VHYHVDDLPHLESSENHMKTLTENRDTLESHDPLSWIVWMLYYGMPLSIFNPHNLLY